MFGELKVRPSSVKKRIIVRRAVRSMFGELMVHPIDDLRKSRGLHSVSAYSVTCIYIYRSMPAGVAQSSHAFVEGTLNTWATY